MKSSLEGITAMAKPFPNEDEAFAYLADRYNVPMDEARRLAIGNNLASFFSILNEWDLKQKETEVTPNVLETHNLKENRQHESTKNKKPAP
jgi:hypothetical protein